MRINKIVIEGYTNIRRVELSLSEINALVAFNNYGKSNILRAIEFALSFIKGTPSQKISLMGISHIIPINSNMISHPFMFEIDATLEFADREDMDIIYSFSFEWLKSSANPQITSEQLKVKTSGVTGAKYTSYIKRNTDKALYIPSPTGRCDKTIAIDDNNLIINKIINIDEIFFIDIIREILMINILSINTLQDPEQYFCATTPQNSSNNYSILLDQKADPGFFVYSLMKLEPNSYKLLKSAIFSLLPTIEDIEPIEVDLKALSPIKDGVTPFSRPERFYDIRIKEKNNNQQTSIRSISAGSKKIIYTLAMAIGANLNQIPLIMFEELENSIHPTLFQSLLMTFDVICPNTKITLTSHSPYLIKYLSADKIKIGVPNNAGLAIFKQIKPTKVKRILRLATEQGVTLGDYIFSLMYDAQMGEVEPLEDICI